MIVIITLIVAVALLVELIRLCQSDNDEPLFPVTIRRYEPSTGDGGDDGGDE